MKKFITILFSVAVPFFAFSKNSYEENHKTIISAVDIGLYAGKCNTLTKMYEFQEKEKIPNGEEFIDKFIISEASSNGWNIKEFTENCVNTINSVNELKKSSQQGK
ncbi:TPA: hypothetical protein ACS8CD_002204 [Providencia alcalifaciens]